MFEHKIKIRGFWNISSRIFSVSFQNIPKVVYRVIKKITFLLYYVILKNDE